MQYGDSLSKQQKDFRLFNKKVTEERYKEVLKQIRKIIPNHNKLSLNDFWASLTDDQIKQLSEIPEFDAEGFTYITGREVIKEKTEVEKAIELLIKEGKIVDGKVLI